MPPSQQHDGERALAWITLQPASCPTRKGRPSLVFLAQRQEAQSHQKCPGGRWERKLTQPQPQTRPHLSLLGWVAWLETQRCFCSRWDCPTDSVCEKRTAAACSIPECHQHWWGAEMCKAQSWDGTSTRQPRREQPHLHQRDTQES